MNLTECCDQGILILLRADSLLGLFDKDSPWQINSATDHQAHWMLTGDRAASFESLLPNALPSHRVTLLSGSEGNYD